MLVAYPGLDPIMKTMELNSPAKVNLSLAVTGRREDGFHELISLVAPLDFGDIIEVRASGKKGAIALECDEPGIPTDGSNLAFKAADRFREAFRIEEALDIRIEKRIPAGAGLGGGSSNAATTLEALQRIFEIGDEEKLEGIAAEIGSDCPLFLRRCPLVVRGRGEILEELPESVSHELAGREIILFKPTFSISTKWAYQSLAAASTFYDDAVESQNRLLRWLEGDLALGDLLSNTLEKVVDRKFPALPLMRESVRNESGLSCLMSGSGSCSFALGDGVGSGLLELRIREDWGKRCFFETTRIAT